MALDEMVDHLGTLRKLGWVEPDKNERMVRASRFNIQILRAQTLPSEPPVLTMAQLTAILQTRKIDFTDGAPTSLINDQGSEGACTYASACGCMQRGLWMRGMNDGSIQLSWQYGYDQGNGGSDNGSSIAGSLSVVQKGIPLMAEYPKSLWVPGRMPPNATVFREDVPMTLGTALECATALTMDILPHVPLFMNQAAFERFTGDGIAYGGKAPGNTRGNHAIYLAGLRVVAGVIYFVMVNSWGHSWGPFKNGTCLIPFACIDNCDQADDGVGHASPILPQSMQSVPSPVLSA